MAEELRSTIELNIVTARTEITNESLNINMCFTIMFV